MCRDWGWKSNRVRLQYLMERLGDMKSLKFLSLDEVPVADAPFYLECAQKMTADIGIEFENAATRYNFKDLARSYKQYKESFSWDERYLFSLLFQYEI